ncbi:MULTISPECIES: hypothetical protein [Bacillus]|uniref:hypothetical protein n=1 Tax=Bacillus TaxID=1386 RepID=UPI00032D7933|nr:hypothetical protein ICS_02752 [Bacillus cereus BAG2O-3]EOQ11283.1 hypothetical protein KQ3_02138 [Bacillus cereus B5-2]EOQ30131.1 hypothetical protein KQ1_02801 [Bacillus cereus BAG3O-1]MBJ8118107.1 hypothetical protein [Bacillus cereus]PFW81950.1 hypothetical protein COL27_18245 [Bacillus sp. AFS075960]RFB13101.1 hypothetical protein DZB88_14345 [Bacillus sp. OE]RFB23617.1 hypothetical protein DZB85_14300 [Bacillus sp. LB(2018)]RFB43476.1 hypothetical protein DZB83_23215 [Bacillus sp. d
MSNLGMDLSDSRLIVANVEEKEYHFIVREHPIVGKIISLLENGKEYGLIDKQIANNDKFIISELTKLDYFNIDVLYYTPGWIWIGMDQFGLHAREATYNEVDVIMKLKEDLYYIDVYEKVKM